MKYQDISYDSDAFTDQTRLMTAASNIPPAPFYGKACILYSKRRIGEYSHLYLRKPTYVRFRMLPTPSLQVPSRVLRTHFLSCNLSFRTFPQSQSKIVRFTNTERSIIYRYSRTTNSLNGFSPQVQSIDRRIGLLAFLACDPAVRCIGGLRAKL